MVVDQAALGAQALEDHAQHRVGHRPERSQRLVAVAALLEVDLRHAVGAAQRVARVQQHRGLDRVAGGEREPVEERAPGGHLAGERLDQRGQLGIERGQQRPRGQLGHAPAVVGPRLARGGWRRAAGSGP